MPRNQRVVINPPQFCTKPWQTMTSPKPNIHSDTISTSVWPKNIAAQYVHHVCGFNFFINTLDGISKMM